MVSEYNIENFRIDCSTLLRTVALHMDNPHKFMTDDGRNSMELLRDYIKGLDDDDMKNFSAEEFMIWFNMRTGNDPKKMIYELWRTFKRRKMGQLNCWTMDWSPENCVLDRLFPHEIFAGKLFSRKRRRRT